jgi:hypothetical protein
LSGERSKKTKLSPEEVQARLLLEIRDSLKSVEARLENVDKMQKEATPEGAPVYLSATVTGTTVIKLLEEYPYRKLMSVDIYNGGPDVVKVKINDQPQEVPIDAYAAMPTLDFKKPKVEKIELKVDSGSASVEIYGFY